MMNSHNTSAPCSVIRLLCVVLLLSVSSAALSAGDGSTLALGQYVAEVIERSSALAQRFADLELARENLASVRFSDGSDYDVEEARIALDYRRRLVESTRAGLVPEAARAYIAVLRAERNLEHTGIQLQLREEAERASRRRWEEGVRTEADYLNDMMARLSAEIALMNAENGYARATRTLLRLAERKQDESIAAVEFDLVIPDVDTNLERLITLGRQASASYQQAVELAQLNRRRYHAYRELGQSVSARLLTSSERALESAEANLRNIERSLEDQAWELMSRYEVLRKTADVAEIESDVAQRNWSLQQERYEFGIIMESDLTQQELSYRRSLSSAREKVEDLLLHILDLQAFTATQPADFPPGLGPRRALISTREPGR